VVFASFSFHWRRRFTLSLVASLFASMGVAAAIAQSPAPSTLPSLPTLQAAVVASSALATTPTTGVVLPPLSNTSL